MPPIAAARPRPLPSSMPVLRVVVGDQEPALGADVLRVEERPVALGSPPRLSPRAPAPPARATPPMLALMSPSSHILAGHLAVATASGRATAAASAGTSARLPARRTALVGRDAGVGCQTLVRFRWKLGLPRGLERRSGGHGRRLGRRSVVGTGIGTVAGFAHACRRRPARLGGPAEGRAWRRKTCRF